MSENMKKFLEAVSKSEELTAKVGAMGQDELIALATELGITLADADFTQPSGELQDDELEAVAGGKECYCAMGGGGEKGKGQKTCACVMVGSGHESGGDQRCVCVAGGYGSESVEGNVSM